MPINENKLSINDDLALIESEADEIYEAEYGALNRAKERSFLTRAGKVGAGVVDVGVGVVQGAGNAVADVADTVTDLGFMAGIQGASALGSLFTSEDRVDEEALYKNLQGWRDSATSFIRSEESDSAVQNFAMGASESVLKFGFFYKNLAKVGVGGIKGVVGAGALEGFTDDPEKDLLLVDDAIRGTLSAVSPNSVADFDKAMDMNTDPTMARELIRRSMSAVELALLSGAAQKGSELVGAGAREGFKHLPDEVKKTLVDATGAVMEKSRSVREWLAGGKKEPFANYTPSKSNDISFDPTTISEGASPRDAIRQGMNINFDPSRNIKDKAVYDTIISEYENKLASLVPQIKDTVVNLGKARNVAEKESLGEFVRALGVKEAEDLTEEGLKNVLKAQAHNIVFEQQTMAFKVAADQLKRGNIQEDAYIESAKSLYTAFYQRMSLLSGAGKTLVTARYIPKEMQKLSDDIRAFGADMDTTLAHLGKTLDDPAAAKVMAEALEGMIDTNMMLGKGSDDIMNAMAKAIRKPDKTKTLYQTAKDYADAVGTTYQANLLSSIPTLTQNTIGAIAQMELQTAEMIVRAGRAAIFGRSVGTPTFREAMIYQRGILAGHLNAFAVSAKAASVAITQGKSAGGAYFNHRLGTLPEMTDATQKALFRVNKTDMTAKLNPVNERIARNSWAHFLTARPILDAIGKQDMATKFIASKAHLEGRWDTALYVDDVFGLNGKVKNIKEAYKAMDGMFRSGGKPLTPKQIKAIGIDEKDAISLNLLYKRWQREASKSAETIALDATMQTPMSPFFKKVQTIAQDDMPGGRLFVPFFSTPANIIDSAIQRAPLVPIGETGTLGLPIHPQFYKDMLAGGEKRDAAIARATTGMAIANFGAILTDNELFNYTPFQTDEARTVNNMFNTSTGSLTILETSIPVSMLGPAGVIMSIGASIRKNADFVENLKHAEDDDQVEFSNLFVRNIASFMQIMRESPYMKPVEDLADLIGFDFSNEEKLTLRLQEWAGKTLGALAPYSSAQRHASNMFMEERTRANGMWENAMQQFAPYMNLTAYNYMGEPIFMSKSKANILVRANNIQKDDIALDLLHHAGFVPKDIKLKQMVPGYDGQPPVEIRLRNDQFDKLNTIIRDELNVRSRLAQLVLSEDYQIRAATGNYVINHKEAMSILNNTRTIALQKLISEDADLRYDIEKKRKEIMRKNNIPIPVPGGQQTPEFRLVQ